MGYTIGTTSTKSVAVDIDAGDVLAAVSSSEYSPESLEIGWSRQDANVWMQACFDSIREVFEVSGRDKRA